MSLSSFDYPQILRRPAEDILVRFQAGGLTLILTWYAFAMIGIPFLFAILLYGDAVKDSRGRPLLKMAATFGTLGGVFQILGLMRWVFVVPVLAQNPDTASIQVFKAFHQYFGVAVGEHLGQMFMAIWTFLVAVSMDKAQGFPRWLPYLGISTSVVWMIGLTDGLQTVLPFQIAWLHAIPVMAFLLWSIWLIATGVSILLGRQPNCALNLQCESKFDPR